MKLGTSVLGMILGNGGIVLCSYGIVAQFLERLHCILKVLGSILVLANSFDELRSAANMNGCNLSYWS